MSFLRLALGALAILACVPPVHAQTFGRLFEGQIAIVTALRGADCVMTESAVDGIAADGAFDPDVVDSALLLLVEKGLVILDDVRSEVRLIAPLCNPAGADMRTVLTATVRLSGCRLSEVNADRVLTGLGLTQDMTRDTAQAMLAAGEMVDPEYGYILSPALCEGSDGPVPAPRGMILAALRAAPDCALDRRALDHAGGQAFGPEGMARVLAAMVERGEILGDDQRLALAAGECPIAEAPAVGPTEDPEGNRMAAAQAALTAAAMANDCTIGFEGALAALGAQGFTEEEIEAAGEAMLASGLVDNLPDEVLLLVDCTAPEAEGDRMAAAQAALTAAAMANDCTIGFEGALAALGAQGFTEEEIEAAGEAMLASGLVDNLPDEVLLLVDCTAPEAEGDRMAAAQAALTAAAMANDCTIGFEGALAALGAQGFTEEEIEAAGEAMLASGLVDNLPDEVLLLVDCTAPEAEGDRMAAAQAALTAAAMANDCTIGVEGALAELGAQGFTEDEIEAAGEAMLDAGLAENTAGDVLLLSAESCTPLADPAVALPEAADPVTAIMLAMRDNGCTITSAWLEGQEERLIETFGAEALEAAENRFEALTALGDVVIDNGAGIATLSADLCAGGPGRLAGAEQALVAAAAADCTLDFATAVSALAAQGFGEEEVEAAGEMMLALGEAEDIGGDRLRFAASLCTPANEPAPEPATDPAPEPAPEPASDPAPAPVKVPAADPVDVIAAYSVESAAYAVDGALRANGCGIRVKDIASLDRVLVPPLAAALAVAPGDPATDRALRELALRGIDALAVSGRLAILPGTGEARLVACP